MRRPRIVNRLANDEQADAEAVASRSIEAGKSFEGVRHLVAWAAYAVIVHVDTDERAYVAAAKHDTATGLGIFYRVAHQVVQRSA